MLYPLSYGGNRSIDVQGLARVDPAPGRQFVDA